MNVNNAANPRALSLFRRPMLKIQAITARSGDSKRGTDIGNIMTRGEHRTRWRSTGLQQSESTKPVRAATMVLARTRLHRGVISLVTG